MTNKDIEDMKSKIDELTVLAKQREEENKSLKQRIKDLEDVCDGSCFSEPVSDAGIDRDALIAELQDQHQQDCIRINDLTTAVHVLAGLYSELRKNVGMD